MNQPVGKFTIACRYICSALAAGPLLYWSSVTDGDAYHFLALVLLAPIAGLVLLTNSLFCFARYRTGKSAVFSLVFIVIAVIGLLSTWHFLPQFGM